VATSPEPWGLAAVTVAPPPPAPPRTLTPPAPAPPPAHQRPSRPAIADRLRDLADADGDNGIGGRLLTMVRTATDGLADPGALEAQGLDRALVEAVCLTQPRPRVIGVLSGKGGTGATTTAAGIALTLAALRDDDTLLVDARSGSASLATRLAGRVAPNVADLIRDPYLTPLATTGGLRVLDGTPWFDAAGEDLVTVLEPLTGRHGFTVVDLGNDTSGGAGSALAAADQMVVVTGTDQTSMDATRIAFDRIRPRADGTRLGDAVVVIVCTRPGSHARIGRMLRGELSADVARIVTVPYDRSLASGGPIDMSRLNRRTRRAYLTVAALLGDPR
jgi:MinD-like ATPase involved in chromosome partitioning or flagellar assembly